MTVSWQELNAYVDGELDTARAAAVAAAIATDADLAARVATLARLKAVAQEATPEMFSAPALPQLHRPARWRPALIAASLTLALIAGATPLMLRQQAADAPESSALQAAVSLHRNWTAASSVGQPGGEAVAAPWALSGIPDLTAAGLVLDRFASSPHGEGEAALLGYRGPRGCQVSLWIGRAEDAFGEVPARREMDGVAAYVWRVERRGYALLARNMDEYRLATLASAVARITREHFHVDNLTRMALQQSADPAAPCRA